MNNTDSSQHYRLIRRVLIVILALNWAVAFAKIIFGMLSRCASMTADGFHSLSDGASNIIGIIGIHFACQPKDKDHPYGHKKYETFFSLGISTLLLIVCFELIQEGVKRLRNPVLPEINAASFIIMSITMLVNFLVMRYEYKKGKSLGSDILVSDSLHTRADLFTSVSVIITLVSIKLGFHQLDAVATLMIAVFIGYAAFEIIKGSSRVLCDEMVLEEKRILEIVLKIKGVMACHKIRTRGRNDDINVDLHVQVDPGMQMQEAHRISYRIEEAIKNGIPQVGDVIVHMEPKEGD